MSKQRPLTTPRIEQELAAAHKRLDEIERLLTTRRKKQGGAGIPKAGIPCGLNLRVLQDVGILCDGATTGKGLGRIEICSTIAQTITATAIVKETANPSQYFGNDSTTFALTAHQAFFSSFIANQTNSIISIGVHVNAANGAQIHLAVYGDMGGAPDLGNLINYSPLAPAVDGWNDFNIPANLVNGVQYWVAVQDDNGLLVVDRQVGPTGYNDLGASYPNFPTSGSLSSNLQKVWHRVTYASGGTTCMNPAATAQFDNGSSTWTAAPGECMDLSAFVDYISCATGASGNVEVTLTTDKGCTKKVKIPIACSVWQFGWTDVFGNVSEVEQCIGNNEWSCGGSFPPIPCPNPDPVNQCGHFIGSDCQIGSASFCLNMVDPDKVPGMVAGAYAMIVVSNFQSSGLCGLNPCSAGGYNGASFNPLLCPAYSDHCAGGVDPCTFGPFYVPLAFNPNCCYIQIFPGMDTPNANPQGHTHSGILTRTVEAVCTLYDPTGKVLDQKTAVGAFGAFYVICP